MWGVTVTFLRLRRGTAQADQKRQSPRLHAIRMGVLRIVRQPTDIFQQHTGPESRAFW